MHFDQSARDYDDMLDRHYGTTGGFEGYADPTSARGIRLQKKHALEARVRRPIPVKLRMAILKRDNFRCQLCGATTRTRPDIELHVDHKHPHSRGGDASEENLWVLCNLCNFGKGAASLNS